MAHDALSVDLPELDAFEGAALKKLSDLEKEFGGEFPDAVVGVVVDRLPQGTNGFVTPDQVRLGLSEAAIHRASNGRVPHFGQRGTLDVSFDRSVEPQSGHLPESEDCPAVFVSGVATSTPNLSIFALW